MRPRGDLVQFVRDALVAGRSRDEIRAATLGAGWRERDVERALGAFASTPFLPPVPRPQGFVSARDAMIYALAFFALSVVVVSLTTVMFDLVDAMTGAERPGMDSSLAWWVSTLVVFAPLFAAIDFRADRDSPVRKIFAYAAFFFAALVLLFTLVSVIALLLSGGLSVEVSSKAAVVAAIAVGVLLYYRGDLRADRG